LRDYGTDKALEIGSEKTPDEFVAKMVSVFQSIRRILRDDGTVWLNLGDTYNANQGLGFPGTGQRKAVASGYLKDTNQGKTNLKSGNLVGIPWRVALALQADGWILRQDIIWHKPSPMPESVRNRCTKAHEYIFLLTKSMKYYYDADAIKTKTSQVSLNRCKQPYHYAQEELRKQSKANTVIGNRQLVESSNKRSVWTITSQGYDGAHFATFPEKLVEPCILAGTSEYGCCSKCGAPYRRITERTKQRKHATIKRGIGATSMLQSTTDTCANSVAGVESKTLGWQATCDCNASVVPCTVLDPFIGSGTTAAVAAQLGRRSVGIDLSQDYLQNNAVPRIEGRLMSIPKLSSLVAKPIRAIKLGRKVST